MSEALPPANVQPDYFRVLLTFAKNSLVRELTFRGNFVIELITRGFWFAAQIVMFDLIYRNVTDIAGWSRYEFFAFMATGMTINTLNEAFFMPNFANFSEMVRTGNLDFALLKPIDTQFLVSFEKLDLGSLSYLAMSCGLLGYALHKLDYQVQPMQVVMYIGLVATGVVFFYNLMISMASTSIWFGRNQSLYDFWFYITIFSRYPRSFFGATRSGELVQMIFSYVIPILLVVTVPAEVIVHKVLTPSWITWVVIGSSVAGLYLSRKIFQWSLRGYRSASS